MSKHHIQSTPRGAGQPTPGPRRLRAPRLSVQAKWRLQNGFVYQPPAMSSPYVDKIIEIVEEMVRATQLTPQVILEDWLGMIDGALLRWAENIKSIAIEGKFIKDTPEYFEIFRRARERFMRSSAMHNPAAYAKMQEAFILAFNILKEAALPLEDYAQQGDYHPDVVGQVFVHFFPTPAWRQYFCHDWEACLDYALAMMPPLEKVSEDVFLGIREAQVTARRKETLVELKPGENFLDWLMSIKPFYVPTEVLLIQEPMALSTGALLAAASQVPDWIRDNDLVRFHWFEEGMDPVIERLNRININLYGLNGFTYHHVMAALDIMAHQKNEPADIIRLERDEPAVLYHANLLTRYGDGEDLRAIRGATTAEQIEEALGVLGNIPVPVDEETNIPVLVPPAGSPWSRPGDRPTFTDVFKRPEGKAGDKEGQLAAFMSLFEQAQE